MNNLGRTFLLALVFGISALPRAAFGLNGDVNLDGVVNRADIEAISRYIVGSSTFIASPFNADANHDRRINIQDALILLQYVNGLRQTIPQISSSSIAGNITGTLSAAITVYVATGDLTVPAGRTLTLAPGVIVKMSPGTRFVVNGTLISQGTAVRPVFITSTQDDSLLGDTIGDGPTEGAPGQWGSLQFNNSTAATQLTYTTIRFGQQVILSAASPKFDNLTFSSMSLVAVSADIASFPSGSGNLAFGSPLNGIDMTPGRASVGGAWSLTGLPYVIRSGEILFPSGSPLSIAPGVVVKGSRFTAPFAWLQMQSPLTALGTPTAPIIFTSLRDDSVGGDTNGDDGSSSPAPKDWIGVYLNGINTSGSQLANVQVRFGGDFAGVNLWVRSGTGINLTNCQISSSSGVGFYTDGGAAVRIEGSTLRGNQTGLHAVDGVTGPIQLINNTFIDNQGWGAVLSGLTASITGNRFERNANHLQFQNSFGSPALSSNTFRNSLGVAVQVATPNIYLNDQGGNTSDTNGLNGIDITAGTWTRPGTWNFKSLPYVIRSGEVLFTSAAPLTLAPGVIVKGSRFTSALSWLRIQSPLTAIGTATAPIIFTSLRDDSVGGDTNRDELAVSPAPRDWIGVYLQGATASGSQLSNVQVRYGGDFAGVNLWIRSGTGINITNSKITDSSSAGLYIDGTAGVQVLNSRIENNRGYGMGVDAASNVGVHQSVFSNNNSAGILNVDNLSQIDAIQNYWGSPSGPRDAGNPGGTGDPIIGPVSYKPFLTETPIP